MVAATAVALAKRRRRPPRLASTGRETDSPLGARRRCNRLVARCRRFASSSLASSVCLCNSMEVFAEFASREPPVRPPLPLPLLCSTCPSCRGDTRVSLFIELNLFACRLLLCRRRKTHSSSCCKLREAPRLCCFNNFAAAAQRRHGVQPNAPAAKHTLTRRSLRRPAGNI